MFQLLQEPKYGVLALHITGEINDREAWEIAAFLNLAQKSTT
jgi:hypothetical protein